MDVHDILIIRVCSMFLAVLDKNMSTLLITELARGMGLTLKYFFDRKVTVRKAQLESVCKWFMSVLTHLSGIVWHHRLTTRSRRDL